MTEDEQIDLVTFAWVGRGDGSIEDWGELRSEAAHNKRTTSYLLGMPLLADYLDVPLSEVPISHNRQRRHRAPVGLAAAIDDGTDWVSESVISWL
jgi:Protein of unknown function (DUF3775)